MKKLLFLATIYSLFLIIFPLSPVLGTDSTPPPQPVPIDICKNLNEPQKSQCYSCVGQPTSPTGKSWTVFGCLSTSTEIFVGTILKYSLSLAGTLALFLIIFSGLQMMTASGDPEKLERGRDLLISAVVGLLIIIFSVVILQLIGVQILQIPGLPQFGR